MITAQRFTCDFLPLFVNDGYDRGQNKRSGRLKSLEFHVRSDDYFGTVATILNYIAQANGTDPDCGKILENIKNDLLYLQEKYKIIKK